MGRTKTSIKKEQIDDRAVIRKNVSADIGLVRNHKAGVLYYQNETIGKLFTDISGNEYIKTYLVGADFTGSSNFSNDLTNFLVEVSDLQLKADKLGTGFTNMVASLDAAGNLQSTGYDQSGLHTHSNLAVLDAISNAGSGAIITTIERNKLNGIETAAKNNLVSNVGATGEGVFRDQTGSTFNLRKIDVADNKLGVSVVADRIVLAINEANISLNANQIVFDDTGAWVNATDVQNAIQNLSQRTIKNTWRIGDESAGDKYLRFAISAGPNDPGFRYLNSGTKLQYSNDGTTWNDILPPTNLEKFISADQTITSGGELTLPHGLSTVPFMVQAYLICQTADFGFSRGDIVLANLESNDETQNYGASIVVDATNIYIRFGTQAKFTFIATRKDSGQSTNLTNANWNFRVHAMV